MHENTWQRPGRRQMRLIALLGAAVLLVVLSLVAWIVSLFNPSMARLPFDRDTEWAYTGNGFIYLDGSTLRFCNTRGKQEWELALGGSDYDLAASTSLMAVYNGERVLLINRGGDVLMEETVEGGIQEVVCGKSRALVLTSGESGQVIEQYNLLGDLVAELGVPNDSLIGFGSYGDDLIWMHTRNEGPVPSGLILTYNGGQEQRGSMNCGRMEASNVVSNGAYFFIVTEERVYCYTAAGVLVNFIDTTDWQVLDVAVGEQAQVLLRSRGDGTQGRIVHLPSQRSFPFELPEDCLGAALRSGKIYAVTERNLFTYNLGGKQTGQRKLSFAAKTLVPGNNHLILDTGQSGERPLYLAQATYYEGGESAMNLLDVAIIGVFLLFAFLGLYNGFMVSLLGTASFFVSWLCGVLFSPLVANSILSHEGLTSAMLYYTEGAELVTDVALRQMPVNQLSAGQLDAILKSANLPAPIDTLVASNMAGEVFSGQGITTVGDYFNQTIVNFAVNVVSFLIVFLLVRLILCFFIHGTDYVVRLPMLKHFDGALGMGFGLVRGFFAVFVIFMLAPLALVVLQFESVRELIDNSFFGPFFYYSNFLLAFIKGV